MRIRDTSQYNAVHYNTTTNYDLSPKPYTIIELTAPRLCQQILNIIFLNVKFFADLLYWIAINCTAVLKVTTKCMVETGAFTVYVK